MNGRWWEYYAVRYLVGSVVGAVAILYLGKYSGAQFSEHVQPLFDPLLRESNYFLSAIALAALGFAFCYVASSPVLVFHTCRAYFRFRKLWECWKEFSKVCQIVVVIAITVIADIIILIFSSYLFIKFMSMPATAGSKHLSLLGMILLLSILIPQIALLIFACIDGFKTIKTFYEDLAKTREKLFQTEYTTSYRHLREHGNAMGIIVLEVILAFALANLPSINSAVVVLVLWILPGVFACTAVP